MNLILERTNGARVTGALQQGQIKYALVVTGATENHGNHLPYGSDTLTPWAIALRVAEHVDGLVLVPPIPYGMSAAHLDFPLTISLRPETLAELYFDVFDSLAAAGLGTILIINGHDGNIMSLRQAGVRLRRTHPGVLLYSFELWGIDVQEIFGADGGAGHAGETETSVVMHLYPELVDMTAAVGAPLQEYPQVWTNQTMRAKTTTGATGDPSRADSTRGGQAIERTVAYMVERIRALDAQGDPRT